MARRLSVLLLICVILLSVCVIPAYAADNEITIVIDLTGYQGEVNGSFSNFANDNGGTLIAGKKNTFLLNDATSGKVAADFSLSNSLSSYNSWVITGTMGNGNDIASYIVDDAENQKLVFYRDIDHSVEQITIQGNHFVLSEIRFGTLRGNWAYGTTIIFTPIIETGGDCPVTAKSENADLGVVSVVPASSNNQYILSAIANDGYSFSHWLEEGIEDKPEYRNYSNPYIVTADTEITYVAYFRDRYTVNVNTEDANKGTVASKYLGADNGQDCFRFTATPTAYCAFDHWESDGVSYVDNPLDVSVSENGQSYIAYFIPLELTISENAVLNMTSSVNNSFVTGISTNTYGGLLSSGCRSTLYIPVTFPADLPGVSVRVRVTDTQGRELGDYTENRDYYSGSGYFAVTFDPTASDIIALSAEITLTTPAGSSTVSREFSEFNIAKGKVNDDYHFVTSPEYGYSSMTVEQAGIPVTGVYARTDANTKALSLYFFGSGGVYAYDAAASINLTQLEGLSNQNIIALGPAGKNGLTCVVRTGASGSSEFGYITLYQWDGESWKSVSESQLSAASSQEASAPYLVMNNDDVWTISRHWTGEAWKEHNYDFKSFQRVSDTEVYGTDADGNRWRYDGAAWTQTEAMTNTPLDISSVTRFGVNGSTINVGQDQHDDWYLFIESRSHYIGDSDFYGYNGSDVYKWDGSKWVYQIMSDFNDPNDDPMETSRRIRPDGVNALCVPAPGVSVMYGGQNANGAIYLSADNVTITFDPGEGKLDDTALETLTAPILSEIDSAKIPGATRDGFTFVGWFYDDACTVEFKSGDAVMPGANVTLYAKWDENADPLAYHRQKALDELDKQFNKYSEADYTAENWQALVSAYEEGKKAINEATEGTPNIEENVTAALNAAIAAMQAIEPKDTSKVTVAISMDANTLGLGYILEPTLVTVEKGTPVSVVITDLLSAQAAEKYGITSEGLIQKQPPLETMSTLYPWASSGAVRSDFYLSDVYFPEQTGYKLPAELETIIGGQDFKDADKNGKYLSEFDYMITAGWLYSVGAKDSGTAAEFPGVGANGWSLTDGEVVRWQFTLLGLGADLGADNTAWGGEPPVLSVGDKTDLTWAVATLRSQYSDATLKAETVYTDALAVLTDAEATQAAIKEALAALNDLTFTEPVTGVSLDQTELSVTVGKTAELKATVEPDNATDKTVTWSSEDETVATVADGVVTGVKAGTTTITVTTKDGGKTATCAVTVVDEDIPVSGVTLDKESAELTVGETLALTATVAPSGAADKTVTWSSSDKSVATVENGVVTAVKPGTATITVTTKDGGKTATCTVTVKAAPVPVTGVTLDKTTAEVSVGETVTLTAAVAPEDATDKTVTWGSSDVTIARVSDGVVTGVKAGKATITVTTADGEKTASCLVTVTEKQEEPDESQLKYTDALNAVLFYVEDETPTPTVNSVGGEWAVFALNRGGAAKDNWNDRYLANLSKTLDEKNGVLSSSVYTEYSRVILALTSMGVDAGQVTTDKAAYDLVKPLLDKDDKGDYMAAAQGNSGTSFALLAVDSHDYLPGAEGKALRAGLIASLKAKQQESGAWAISGTSGQSFDTTAAAVYALAPYYLDEGKLAALGGSVTHAELKAMVDDALAFLSGKQDENGGFGSAEADGWVIIALSTLGRDADKEEQFVKNGKSVLDDLLSYFDKTTGGFRHLADGGVDQMASEQAAYDLVAYDRFKNGKNTLYDMTDVEIASLEEKADKAAAEEVEKLIDAIGEVTLEKKASIAAARSAYDKLTDAQKKLVSNYDALEAAETAYAELEKEADQETLDKAAAKGVDEKISAIGAVTLESENAIKAARAAYDALTDAQKALVEGLAALEAAEAKLAQLKKNEEPLVSVTFHLQGGSCEGLRDGEKKNYKKGDENGELPQPTRENYSFEGWFDRASGGEKYTVITAGLPADLYAQWKSSGSGGGGGSSGGSSEDEGKLKVTFRLIGARKADKDVDLGAEEYMPDYVTWIATTTYNMEEGSTVYDLWVQATRDAGIRSEGADKNYVKTVYAPGDGYALSEFTNGKRSGWMYTINGSHPGFGLKEQELHDGDRVVWHYVNDYSYEVADWFEEDPRWPSLGDGRYYNRWLKAPDRVGGYGGGLGEGAQAGGGGGSSGSISSEIAPSNDGDTVVITADVDHSEGGMAYAADAELDKKTVAEGLEKAEDKSSLKLWVEMEDSNRLVLRVETEAMKEIADAGAGLRLGCGKGVIELDADAVALLAESGREVRMVVSYNDWYDKTTVSVSPYPPTEEDLGIRMKIELPVTKEGQALSIVNGDGTTTPIKKSAIIGDRVYAEVPSGTTVTITESRHYWDDVKDKDWFADAVSFVVSHELMNGVDRYEFAPNDPMTRAMLVTVLYRLEDEPEFTGGLDSFGDVDVKSWYAEAVAWASESGLVNGTENGFEPGANITREQIATILYRYAKYIGLVGQDTAAPADMSAFGDGEKVSSWAQEAMAWAVEVGLFKGDDTGSLNPQGNATRAEVATLLERLIKLIVVS